MRQISRLHGNLYQLSNMKKENNIKESDFSYVDVVGEGCEGWINLFFEDYIIALIRDVEVANKMKEQIVNKLNKDKNES